MHVCVWNLLNFLLLIAIVMYVFALLGLELFAGKLRFGPDGSPVKPGSDEEVFLPRMNFDSLFWALMSIFKVLMAREWNILFYDCIRGAGLTSSLLYFVSLVTIG